jgi:hypothetical protein
MRKVSSNYSRKKFLDCRSKPLTKLVYENIIEDYEVVSTAVWRAVVEVILALALKLTGIAILYFLFVFIYRHFSGENAEIPSSFIYTAATIPAWMSIKDVPNQLHFCFAKVYIYKEYVTKETGFFRKHISKLYFEDIDNIQLSRPLLARVMGFTDVTLTSHGGDIELPNITDTDDSLGKLKKITDRLSENRQRN